MLKSVLVLMMAIFAGHTLVACGPERSSEAQKITEREENRKLDRDELLRRAEARRSKIPKWAGCYIGRYDNSGPVEVIVALRPFVQLVYPGANDPGVEPVEIPILRGVVSAKANSEWAVSLTEFEANEDASFIQIRRGATARLALFLDEEGRNHYGDYETPVLGAREIQLRPTNSSSCRN